jgi:hypothetical protein
VSPDSPAFDVLQNLGMIDEEGNPTFPNDPDDPLYPYSVAADGSRLSHVVRAEHGMNLPQAGEAYVEDRLELRHTSDGVMAVTDEGDGFQAERIHPVLIEDVRGTVVGNDPHSDGGRAHYKRILSMKVFDSVDDGSPSPGPRFEVVDTVQSSSEADTLALCRLFKITNPSTGAPAYTFGVSKEGRVFLWMGKSQTGEEKRA